MSIEMHCPHPTEFHQIVSDVVVYLGLRNGAESYEVARQIIACQHCGAVVDNPIVERPHNLT